MNPPVQFTLDSISDPSLEKYKHPSELSGLLYLTLPQRELLPIDVERTVVMVWLGRACAQWLDRVYLSFMSDLSFVIKFNLPLNIELYYGCKSNTTFK